MESLLNPQKIRGKDILGVIVEYIKTHDLAVPGTLSIIKNDERKYKTLLN